MCRNMLLKNKRFTDFLDYVESLFVTYDFLDCYLQLPSLSCSSQFKIFCSIEVLLSAGGVWGVGS
jgi:hypothetical protein